MPSGRRETAVSMPLTPSRSDLYWRRIFEKYDKDKDGRISYVELKEIIESREYEHDLPDNVVDKIMKLADRDNSGFLDFNEFVAMMHNPDLKAVFGHFVARYVHSIIPQRGPVDTTESPRRGGLSPRKKSPVSNVHNVPSSISQLLNSIDYETRSSDILDAIPEREWRLLAALARKREEDDEREKLADQFRKLWQKEKEERELVEAETQDQYQRYINEKRREEKNWQEFRQYQMSLESQLRRRQLIDCIKHKEQRSANLRAYIDDQKTGFMIDKALEEEARAQLAADRRTRLGEAEQFRKHVELIDTQRRADNARKRRTAMLRDASQRVAISNALSSWETTLLRQELSALDAARRAHHAAHAALTDARSVRLMRTRDARRRRARRMAAVTEQMREIIRSGRRS